MLISCPSGTYYCNLFKTPHPRGGVATCVSMCISKDVRRPAGTLGKRKRVHPKCTMILCVFQVELMRKIFYYSTLYIPYWVYMPTVL